MDYTLNIGGRLVRLAEPHVMGILNATPDSFFAGSRKQTERDIAERARQIAEEGGQMIDVGACSTRPGLESVSEEVEAERLRSALTIVRREVSGAIISVDTFRPQVARMAVEELGAQMVNDVSGGLGISPNSPAQKHEDGAAVPPMFSMVARLGVPYVLTSVQPTPELMLQTLARKVQQLRDLGQKDILADPGFGFGKTLNENYSLMASLEKLHVLGLPLLVGISRKSMVWRLLDSTPDEALAGTMVLHTVALSKGASILRVHDVRQAVECVKIMNKLQNPNS